MSWTAKFEQPVRLPDGREFKTLAEARRFILDLPAAQHDTQPVKTAIEALLMAANKTGPILHAQIGIIQLIHGKPNGTIKRHGKKPARKYSVLK